MICFRRLRNCFRGSKGCSETRRTKAMNFVWPLNKWYRPCKTACPFAKVGIHHTWLFRSKTRLSVDNKRGTMKKKLVVCDHIVPDPLANSNYHCIYLPHRRSESSCFLDLSNKLFKGQNRIIRDKTFFFASEICQTSRSRKNVHVF